MKKKKKLLIITLASKKYGIGHLERSGKLAKNLNKKKYEIYLIVIKKDFKNYYNKKIFKKSFYFNNPGETLLLNLILNLKPSLCIIDVPVPNIRFEKKLYENKIKFLVYDNLSRKKIYSNFLINLNPKVTKKDYRKIKFYNKSKIFLGVKYFQFENKIKRYRKKIKQIDKILLFFGGGKVNYNLFKNVLKIIANSKFRRKKIIFVSKQKFDLDKKKYFKKKFNINIKYLYNLLSLNNILKKIDLALITSGTIAFEVSFFRIPMLLTSVSKNQELMAKTWSKLGAGINLGSSKSRLFVKNTNIAFDKISDHKLKSKIYNFQNKIYKNYNNKLLSFLNNIK